jgi:hypothetical protein
MEDDDLKPLENIESRNFNILKTDNELFREEDYVPSALIQVKRVALPKKGEDWEILADGRAALVIKGIRFTKSEREYFRSLDGMRFLIAQYKEGSRSVVKIKESLNKLKKSTTKKSKAKKKK